MAIKRQIRSAFPRQPTRSDRSVLAVAGGLPYNAQRMLAIDKRGFFDIDQTALGTALSPNANARSLDPGIGSTLVTSILYVFNQSTANLSSTSTACQFIGPLADTATPTRPCFAMGSSTGFGTGETIAVLDSTSGVTYITDNIAIGLHSLCFEWNGSDYDIWLDGVKKTTTAGTSGHAAQITMTPYVGTRIFSTQPRFCPILFALSDTDKLSRFIDTPWQVFPPEIRRLHIASGGGGQTISPSFLSSDETFYSPTLTPGAVTVAPSFIASDETFYSPGVTSVVTITPTFIDSAETFHQPTVLTGAVTISPALIDSAETFYTPVVAAGTLFISDPTFIDTAELFHTGSISVGPVTITPTFLDSAETFYTLTISGGSVTLVVGTLTLLNVGK